MAAVATGVTAVFEGATDRILLAVAETIFFGNGSAALCVSPTPVLSGRIASASRGRCIAQPAFAATGARPTW